MRVQDEGKFGQAKRRFGLNRVMAKLADTAASAIAITFLVMNLERWLSHFLLFFGGRIAGAGERYGAVRASLGLF